MWKTTGIGFMAGQIARLRQKRRAGRAPGLGTAGADEAVAEPQAGQMDGLPVSGASIIVPGLTYMATCSEPPGP
jgi:hypothetical protein